MAPRLVWALTGHKLSPQEATQVADDILAEATDLKTLHKLLDNVAKRMD